MNKKTQATIATMAQRMLSVQLQLDPRSKSAIKFECRGHETCVGWLEDKRRWACVVDRHVGHGYYEDLEIPF